MDKNFTFFETQDYVQLGLVNVSDRIEIEGWNEEFQTSQDSNFIDSELVLNGGNILKSSENLNLTPSEGVLLNVSLTPNIKECMRVVYWQAEPLRRSTSERVPCQNHTIEAK